MSMKLFIVVSRYGSDLYTPTRWVVQQVRRETTQRYYAYEKGKAPDRWADVYWDKDHVHFQADTAEACEAFISQMRVWWDDQQPAIDALEDAYHAARRAYNKAQWMRFEDVKTRIALQKVTA